MKPNFRGIGMTSQRTRDRLVKRLEQEGIENRQLLDVIRNTPRHIFVDEALASRSYEDTALPIGYGQTISQPYIVARMTEIVVATGKPQKVLEVGTGSGYQTAIIAQLADKVYSVERIQPLLHTARKRFQELRIRNIRVNHSDGIWGWPDYAPFNAIIVTAASIEIPQSLLDQLCIGGRLVAPIGPKGAQELVLIERTETEFERQKVTEVSFVPLLGGTE